MKKMIKAYYGGVSARIIEGLPILAEGAVHGVGAVCVPYEEPDGVRKRTAWQICLETSTGVYFRDRVFHLPARGIGGHQTAFDAADAMRRYMDFFARRADISKDTFVSALTEAVSKIPKNETEQAEIAARIVFNKAYADAEWENRTRDRAKAKVEAEAKEEAEYHARVLAFGHEKRGKLFSGDIERYCKEHDYPLALRTIGTMRNRFVSVAYSENGSLSFCFSGGWKGLEGVRHAVAFIVDNTKQQN